MIGRVSRFVKEIDVTLFQSIALLLHGNLHILYLNINIHKVIKHIEHDTKRYFLSSFHLLLISFIALMALVIIAFPSLFPFQTDGAADYNYHNIFNTAHASTISPFSSNSCNCIIFRMDDVQDYWLSSVQTAVMNLFLSKNQSISLGLIMHDVGNDSKIVSKAKEGLDKGLFELDLHGYDHIDYTKLSEKGQTDSLYQANAKMQKLFGIKSIVFIPPFDVFNYDTIRAMKEDGIRIISSAAHEENSFNQNKSIFTAKNHANTNDGETMVITVRNNNNYYNSDVSAKDHNNKTSQTSNQTVYHIPATIFFKDYENGKWVGTPLKDIIGNITKNIAKYGYAVVVLHPQDFAKLKGGGATTSINSVDEKEISDLSKLIDYFLSKDMKIVPFHRVIPFQE
jgi:peptidoglycan/xylan/chitin deacetylase (PgdA/CDA1 family)